MSQKRRQVLLLTLLLVVFTVVVGRQLLPNGAGGRARGSEPADWTADVGVGGPAAPVVEVDLKALEPRSGSFSPGRDPFRFYQPPPPRREPPPPPPAQPSAEERRAQRAQAAAATPPKPRPPAIDFRYLGSFGPKERKIAVFSDENEIYNARQGEVVKERFVVVSIGFESADIGFVGFPSEPAQRLAAGG